MWPDQGSNQGPLDLQSDLLLTALGGPAKKDINLLTYMYIKLTFLKIFDI